MARVVFFGSSKTAGPATVAGFLFFFFNVPGSWFRGESTSVTSLPGTEGASERWWGGSEGCQQCNEWRSILSLGQARAFTPRCSPGDTEPRVVARVSQEGYWRGGGGEGRRGGVGRTGHSLLASATYASLSEIVPTLLYDPLLVARLCIGFTRSVSRNRCTQAAHHERDKVRVANSPQDVLLCRIFRTIETFRRRRIAAGDRLRSIPDFTRASRVGN